MLTKTFRNRVRFGAALSCFLLLPGLCVAGADRSEPALQVSVYNEANVSPALLSQAEDIGAAVFERAGVRVQWMNCGLAGATAVESQRCSEARFPTHLHLRILARSRGLREVTLGLSYLDAEGSGCYSDVFFAQVHDIGEKTGESAAMILGHVMAHEIGHLLLGTNSHSALGMMKAHWEAADLESAGRGGLVFSAGEAARMQDRVLTAWSKGRGAETLGAAAAD